LIERGPVMNEAPTEDLVSRLLDHWTAWGSPRERDKCVNETHMAMDCKEAADEIERLREVVTIPIITPEAPPGVYFRVLAEHEKGQPVNAQDLINALMWRVKNQREQLARLNRRV